MSQHTPDAWIERNPDDPGDPYFVGSPNDDDPPHDFICPKCDEGAFKAEAGTDNLCVNCTADNKDNLDSAPLSSRTQVEGPISLMPEPFGINEVLQDFQRRYAPTLLVRISPIIEEGA